MTDLPDKPLTMVDVIRGEFEVIDNRVHIERKPVRRDPIGLSHAELVRELARMHVPQYTSYEPEPSDHEDVADYLLRMAKLFDRHILAIGQEVKSQAVCVVNLDDFTEPCERALSGNATFQADQCAEAVRDERATYRDQRDFDRAHRYGVD